MRSQIKTLVLLSGGLACCGCLHGQTAGDTAAQATPGVRAELKSLLLADVEKAPKPQPAPPAAAPQADPGVISMDSFVVRAPPLQDQRVGRVESNVDRFFRTGVLVCTPGNSVTSKVTVGPCEGGELLNLKFIW